MVDLKVGDYLLPNEKKGGKVYATKEKFQCLIFGKNKESLRDLGSRISHTTLENGTLAVTYTENYPKIFENEFKGKSCFIYELEDDGFSQGAWPVEWFKTGKAKIIKKYKIKDLYTEIMKEVKRNRIQISFYTETREYIKGVINHLMQNLTWGYPIDYLIDLAREHGANAVENYFRKLKELNENYFNSLQE